MQLKVHRSWANTVSVQLSYSVTWKAVKCRERQSWQLRTDPLVVLVLRLINTVSLVRMHYGSFVAVYCLALRGVGCRCMSRPIRLLIGKNPPHRLLGS